MNLLNRIWVKLETILQLVNDIFQSTLALFGKFKKWSKILASVLKTCEYDVRSSKKKLGSIGGPFEEL